MNLSALIEPQNANAADVAALISGNAMQTRPRSCRAKRTYLAVEVQLAPRVA